MASSKSDGNLKDLRAKIEAVLLDNPEGVKVNSFWNCFMNKHQSLPNPKDFGVLNRSDLLNVCSDLYLYVTNEKVNTAEKCIRLRDREVPINEGSCSDLVQGLKLSRSSPKKHQQESNLSKQSPSKSNKCSEDQHLKINKEIKQELQNTMNRKQQNDTFYNKFYQRRDISPYPRDHHLHHAAGNPSQVHDVHVPSLLGSHLNYPFATSDQSLNFPSPSTWQAHQNQSNNRFTNPDFPVLGHRAILVTPGEAKESRPADRQYGTSSSSSSQRKRNRYTRDQLNNVAMDCIERLSESKDYVSLERIEKLLLQHYAVESIQELGLNYLDELKCVYERNRCECKINIYFQTFVKVRAICTLYELCECMKEFTKNRQDFETLRLGPLNKMPLIYEYFKMPSDIDICEIKTSDIMEYLRSYLSENALWNAKVPLEAFLQYITEKRGLATPYELGVRITSMPLAIQALKKAQRDCGQHIRDAISTLKDSVENDISTAFRHFASTVLRKEVEMCAVRTEYLTMTSTTLINFLFTKLQLLYKTVNDQASSWDANPGLGMKRKKNFDKTMNAMNSFVDLLNKDTLIQKLMQLAICCSQAAINYQLMDLIEVKNSAQAVDSVISIDSSPENIPSSDVIIGSINKYLERCIAHGSLTLERLSQIEEKLIQDFNLRNFTDVSQRSFLQFLLEDDVLKKRLEECGGTLLGSSAHTGSLESYFHATMDNLLEFVTQCAFKDPSQHRLIELAVCYHYLVKELRSLGHGSLTNLVKIAEKQRFNRSCSVFYASALVAKQFPSMLAQDRSTGSLGHKTKEQALACLQNCPLLEDLAQWSHWDLVFKPDLKELKDFVQKYGDFQRLTVTDVPSKKVMTTSILAIEIHPGLLLKLTSDTSPEKFAEAASARDISGTCGHLVSLIAINRGLENVPLVLLSNHFKTALLEMQSSSVSEIGLSQDIIRFVLDCVIKVPLIIGQQVINKIFLDPLVYILGQTKCKEQLFNCCQSNHERSHLQNLGILLGIREWSESFEQRLSLPTDCITDVEMMEGIINIDSDSEEKETDKEDSSLFSLSDDDDDDEVELKKEPDEKMDGLKIAIKQKKICDDKTMIKTNDQISDDLDCESILLTSDGKAKEMEKMKNTETGNEENRHCREEDNDQNCRDFIEHIRKEEFGMNIELNEDGHRLVTKQHERLGRSLDRLSRDLYSKDTHFVLELIQNADDNEYPNELFHSVPSVLFLIDLNSITIYNNEVGFNDRNIRAICDVGRTTKGKHKFGYIGQKGIGFKSVFRVTDQPEIHSNGFHIRFDVNSKPLGYILPHWVNDDECTATIYDEWMTCITLPLKQEVKDHLQSLSLAARFRDIHPSLLLFLHRLRRIEIKNQVEGYELSMIRNDVEDNITEISHDGGIDRWLVVRKTLDATHISSQVKSGAEVESTEIALAFPMMVKENVTSQVLPPRQPVFAFLPLRNYGFRFIVQGDFDVPSSREDVDKDSMWNQWLRNEIHHVFINALEVFKKHSEFDGVEAISYFLQFVPSQDEILDFFRPVAANILNQLRAKPCLPSQGMHWKLPCQLLENNDPLVSEVISSALLRKQTGMDYLHRDVAALLSRQLMQSLGVQSMTIQHLIEVGKSIVDKLTSVKTTDNELTDEIVKMSKWLLCVYKNMDEFRKNDDILETLRQLPMIPLSNGQIVSLASQTVFLPLSALESDAAKKNLLSKLESDMCTVHPLVLMETDSVANTQITCFLQKLGVKKLTPHDVIHHHILPSLKASDVADIKSRDLLVTYMLYIKEYWIQQPSLIDANELKEAAIILTNHGPKRPHLEPVHFTEVYQNVNLPRMLPGFEWVLVDGCYLQGSQNSRHVQEWRQFLSHLGILDFLAVCQKKVILKPYELAESLWSSYKDLLPKLDEYHILDSQCAEFAALIKHNVDSSSMISQMNYMFERLDSNWDCDYKKHMMTQITNSQGQAVKEIETSFSILLKTLSWVPSILDKKVELSVGHDLFIPSPKTNRILSNCVHYVVPPISENSSFSRHLGIRSSVDVDLIKSLLLKWSTRSNDDQPVIFKTSICHMKAVYEYLLENLTQKQLFELFEQPIIFYNVNSSSSFVKDSIAAVEGQFLNKKETRWFDPTGLFDKHRENMLSSLEADIHIFRYNLIHLYHDIKNVFLSAKIQLKPEIQDYISLLINISITSPVQKALPDVLLIFSALGKELNEEKSGENMRRIQASVRRQLSDHKVIPGKNNRWFGLDSKPMIADNKQLEKLFSANDEKLDFVDCGEKLGVGGNRSNKDVEMINLDSVIYFLMYLGVEKLSNCVKIESQTEMYKPCPSLQKYIHDVVPYVQRQVHEFREIYEFLVQEKQIKQKLSVMHFAQVAKLQLVHSLTNLPNVSPVVLEEKCRLVDDQQMYIDQNHVNSYSDINREIARYFSCTGIAACPDSVAQRSTECYNSLKFLLSEIQPLLENKSPELDNLIERDGLLKLPADEELWNVPEPLIIVTTRMYSSNDRIEFSSIDSKNSMKNEEMAEESFSGLKSWPPQSSSAGIQHSSNSASVKTAQKWPPPAPPEHMDHTQLPANLRPSTLERPDMDKLERNEKVANTIQQQQPGNTDHSNSKNTNVNRSAEKSENILNEKESRFITKCNKDANIQSEVEERSVAKDDIMTIEMSNVNETKETNEETKKDDKHVLTEQTTEKTEMLTVKPMTDDVANPEPMVIEFSMPVTEVTGSRHKRARVNSGTSSNDFVKPVMKHLITSHFYGPPVWLAETDENVFEHLGSAETLTMPHVVIDDNSDTTVIGMWGELLVKNFLDKCRSQIDSDILEVIHCNAERESGRPYDIIIRKRINDSITEVFVEVKATLSSCKACFEISLNQLLFAQEKGPSYHLYRVYAAGNSQLVQLSKIENLSEKLVEGKVCLMMIM